MTDQPITLKWDHTPTTAPQIALQVQIHSECVDCGRDVWWTRACGATSDPTPWLIPTEPRCYDCTAYRALPWWRRWLRRHP